MSDTDLIRRGDVIREIDCGGCYGSCANPSSCQLEDVEAIRALPAVDPLADPRVKALVQALLLARVHVANNEQGWSVGRASARSDLEIINATLAEIEGERDE
jgi:hypothetical protein